MKQINHRMIDTINSAAKLATVKSAMAGAAKVISYYGKKLRVYTQASHLTLQVNDEVLFFETNKGPFIVARSLTALDMLQQKIQFGSSMIAITADGSICLTTDNAKIILTTQGEIVIDGKVIKQNSKGDIQLSAEDHIHLNSAKEIKK